MRTIAEYIPAEGWLADWCEYLQGRVMAPPEFILASGLAALSAGVGNTVRFRLGGWRWPHLWLLLIAPAGARKSTPASFAESAVEIARGEGSILPRRWSPEGFISGLSAAPDGLWYAGEFSGFLESTRRKDYMSGVRNDLCDIWDGGRFTRRLRKENITIRHCAPTSLATGRASDFENAASLSDFSSGFMSRWLVVVATEKGGYVGWDDEGDSLDDEDPKWRAMCNHLWELRGQFGGWNPDGELIRWTKARRTTEARRLHQSYDEPWMSEELPDELAGWGSRRGIYATKLAILHAISRTGKPLVEPTDVAWGVSIVKTVWRHVKSLTRDVIGLSETARTRQRVYEIGAGMANGNGTPVKVRDWLRAAHRHVRDKKDFESMLSMWEEMGRIRVDQHATGTKGPKARVVWFEHQESPL